jgi:UDP-N-acetylmuramate: L-alanyl-gamma-D-glutamyl-meso-diaminopimelate ligase
MARIHLIAIGGSAMHNLALELNARGHQISGSDDQIFEPARARLKAADLLPEEEGWFPDRIDDGLDLIILGMHAHADNPELAKALELGIRVMSYPEYVYEQSLEQTRVVVAGSHGKTSITSMILHVMHRASQEVNYLVGAQLEGFDRMVRLDTEANFIVIEGDEYGSSTLDPRPKFHWYQPNIALISGIAWDHANIFPTKENYQEQFATFVKNIKPGGTLVYCADDADLVEVVKENADEIKLFPYRSPEFSAGEEGSILHTDEGDVALKIFGQHNLQNLEGARLVCNQMGVMDDEFYASISDFKGANLRLQKVADDDRGLFYRDFAHAPSKVLATVKAVREQFAAKRLISILELHTYSSLNPIFLPQYAGSLDLADRALVYFNPEVVIQKRLPQLDADLLKQFFYREDVEVFTDMNLLKSAMEEEYGQEAVFLLMSSGHFAGLSMP